MENIKFNYNHCKNLIDTEKLEDAKAYVKLFFFRYRDKIFYNDGSNFILYEREQAMKLIPNDFKITRLIANQYTKKFEKEDFDLKKYLLESDFMKDEFIPIIDFSNSKIFTKQVIIDGFVFTENYLNMQKPMNQNLTIKPNKTTESKEGLKFIYNHINDVLCSNNSNLYDYTLNFFSATFGGRKLRKALIWQSSERTGKGQIINGLLKSILDKRMFKCNSTEQILKYSKPFEGCCLLNFDELPHCDNYRGLQDTLKGLITEPTFMCRDMYSSGYEQTNTFNIIITSNTDSVHLSQNNNSRYIVSDIAEHRIGDMTYFKTLSNYLNNDDVKRSFYEDMMARFETLHEWNEDIMPETVARNNKIIEALPMLYKYIKETYILTILDLDAKTDEFFTEYRNITKDKTSVQKLGRLLSSIDIKPIKLSKNMGYKYKKTSTELHDIFIVKKWMDEEVDLINPSNVNEQYSIYKEETTKLKEEIEQLKKQLLLAKQPIKKDILPNNLDKEINDNLDDPFIDDIKDLTEIIVKKNKFVKKISSINLDDLENMINSINI